jgi:hypothetical protein
MLPFVGADIGLEDAVEELRRSKDAGLVLLRDNGAVLFDAPYLYELLPERGDLLMRDVVGGTWLPRESAGDADTGKSDAGAIFIRTDGDRAVVKFFSEPLYTKVMSRMYYCDKNPKHYYDASQVRKLKKITGGWKCGQGDGGTVS